MSTVEEAVMALCYTHNTKLEGQWLKVSFAKSRQNQPGQQVLGMNILGLSTVETYAAENTHAVPPTAMTSVHMAPPTAMATTTTVTSMPSQM